MLLSSFLFAKEYSHSTYVKVTHSEPIYEYKKIKRNNNYQRDYHYNSGHVDNSIGLDTIIGATIGVAIGNQIGRGNKKDFARVAGGIIGASIANNRREAYNYSNYENYNSHVEMDEVLVGYKNYFFYENKQHYKISNRPLREVRITKTINY